MITAKDNVTAISINNLPINPLIKTSGKNTDTSTTVVAIIAKATCLDPLKEATKALSPSSILL